MAPYSSELLSLLFKAYYKRKLKLATDDFILRIVDEQNGGSC